MRSNTLFEIRILAFKLIKLLLEDLHGLPESVPASLQLQELLSKLQTGITSETSTAKHEQERK